MVNISLIKIDSVKRRDRLNAGSYNSLDINLTNLLKKSNICIEFKDLIKSIRRGNVIKPSSSGDTKILTSSNIKTLEVMEKPLKYTSDINPKLKNNDLLVTLRKNVGVAAVVMEQTNESITISSNIIGITVNEHVNPYYAATFLNSKFGRAQFNLYLSGGIINTINPKNLKKFLIPILSNTFQFKIERLVKKAHEKRKLAEKKYHKAETLLYEYLDIEIGPKDENSAFEINSKNLNSDFRLDANYYNPDYINFINILKNSPLGVTTLNKTVTFLNNNLDLSKKKYDVNEIKLVTPDYLKMEGGYIHFKEVQISEIPINPTKIKDQDIFVYSLDKTTLIPFNLNEELEKSKKFIIRAKMYYPEFLFLFFKSKLFENQIERIKTNTDRIETKISSKIFVPIIPIEKQKEISNLMKEHFKLKNESKDIIEESINNIEGEIEKCLQL